MIESGNWAVSVERMKVMKISDPKILWKEAIWKTEVSVAYPGIFFGGVQQIQLRTEDREDGDLGAVAPLSGVLEAAVIWYKKFHFI